MTGYLTCTRCFRPTHSKPEWGNIGAQAAIELCENWLCDDCLDEADRERADVWKARFADRMARMIGDTNRGGGR